MDDRRISEIRRFNRAFARWLGLFDEHYSRTSYSPAESRLLFELAAAGHASPSELAKAMGVDPAYISRLVHKFVASGHVAITPSATDRRRNELALTSDGDRTFAELDAASDRAVAELIAPLSEEQKSQLVTAMRIIAQLLDGGDKAPPRIVLRPHRIGDVAHVVSRQAQVYAGEFGWNGSYEALAAEIAGKFLQEFDPAREGCWIAEVDGSIAGSVFLVDAGKGVAQLRLLYVEPAARGLGIGRMLVEQVIAFCSDKGYRKIRLWTQSDLVAARKIYAAAGFKLTESKPHHSFGRDLVGEYWELEL